MRIIAFILILLPSMCLGDPGTDSLKTALESFNKSLEEFEGIGPENYPRALRAMRGKLIRYLELKKRYCSGNFGMIIFGGNANNQVKKSLSRSEKEICLKELYSSKKKLIMADFIGRKKYFEFLHKRQLELLERTKEAALKEDRLNFSKLLMGK